MSSATAPDGVPAAGSVALPVPGTADTPEPATPQPLQLAAGRPWPLGVHWDGEGLNIALPSAHAERVEWCLFDASGRIETHRAALPGRSQDVWHGYLRAQPGQAWGRPGQLYGFRVHGPWQPENGQRFNPRKLLLDPWGREIVGALDWQAGPFGHDRDHPLQPDLQDNAAAALKSRVIHEVFDWGDDRPPCVPPADRVLCELHVKGFTRLHPGVPEPLRGTYAGLAHEAPVAHLKALGVTTLSLLPVQHWLDEQRLVSLGLRNHWGYNTLGYFCPEPRLAADPADARSEFRRMVKSLHAAGLEVLIDVVFNHTAESDEQGPTLCWRGLDNTTWYRLDEHQPALYANHSGCGNTLDIRQPRVLQMVMDSLRFWVTEMHVDGFRFDLAPVLGRGDHGFDRGGPFFQAVLQDPVLSPLLAGGRLIAEPWDIGPGGYQAGQFPRGWRCWNDGFRDTVRAFWLGGMATRGQFAQALAGSAGRFQARQREPLESVNYIVSHDGFTLRDLVSHDLRHNQANGEDNRDGHGHNLSWNCGAEGDTDDPEVLARRARLQRALLATLLLSQGTPMLAAGDDIGHSQRGNNNPYCQDNPITWIDWSAADGGLARFTAQVLALRRTWLPLGPGWYSGRPGDQGLPDLAWLRPDGRPLDDGDWADTAERALGAWIGAPGRRPDGVPRPLLLLFNAGDRDTAFHLPAGEWTVLLDSTEDTPLPDSADPGERRAHHHPYPLRARSVAVLAGPPLPGPEPEASRP